MKVGKMKKTLVLAAFLPTLCARAANPYLPLWEYVPDGEPHVFEDPDRPGQKRVYLFGSHDTCRHSYCGRDQVVWSAPVDNLNDWRCEGVAFTSLFDRNGAFLNKDRRGDVLFAPDVAEIVDAGGKKTYYLFPNVQAPGRNSLIARSDRPTGPYVVCNWSDKDPKRAVEDSLFGFDPSVFVDDDGRIYGYWGFEKAHGAELDPATMCTVKPGTKVVADMISSSKQPGVFRFFEASSMRKIKGKYVFVYSRKTAEGEFGLPVSNYTLAYAYGDKPLGPFTYGGTIIDARGRETRPDGTTVHTATPNGNTHGGLCEINGQWWVFYHRQTSDNDYTRQAMVAPVSVEVEEGAGGKVVISEAELTSEGFETGGLDPFKRQLAGIACYYTGPTPSYAKYPHCHYSGPYVKPHVGDFYKERDPYGTKRNRSVIQHITPGSTLGYKYFNFDRFDGANEADLVLTVVPKGLAGALTVWAKRPSAAEGGVRLGAAQVEQVRVDVARKMRIPLSGLAAVKGKAALFFTFTSPTTDGVICELEDLVFEKKGKE